MHKQTGKHKRGRQCAALPLLTDRDDGGGGGDTRVLLVTSRETGRWVLPKGWAEKGLSGAALAAKEAFEEAGIVGEAAATEPVGSYRYLKRLPKGRVLECEVEVFALRVDRLLDDWPEREQRERRWFTLAQAAMAVDEGELALLLLRLAAPEACGGACRSGAVASYDPYRRVVPRGAAGGVRGSPGGGGGGW